MSLQPQMDAESQNEAQQRIFETLEKANHVRAQGNESFKAGDIQGALRSYYNVLLSLRGLDQSISSAFAANAPPAPQEDAKKPAKPSMAQNIRTTIGLVYTNMAACHAKSENWKRCLECAREALVVDPNNKKAAFREAQGKIGLGEVQAGKALLLDLNKRAPDTAVTALLKQLELDEKQRQKKADSSFKGFLQTKSPQEGAADAAKDAQTKGKGKA